MSDAIIPSSPVLFRAVSAKVATFASFLFSSRCTRIGMQEPGTNESYGKHTDTMATADLRRLYRMAGSRDSIDPALAAELRAIAERH